MEWNGSEYNRTELNRRYGSHGRKRNGFKGELYSREIW
jgi:hypothetical protein